MDLRGVASHVYRSVQDVPQPAGANSFSAVGRFLGLPCGTRRAMVARCSRSRHHDGRMHTDIPSAECCNAAPGRERIRDTGEDAHIPGICLGEAADEEALAADLQRNTRWQGCADCKPLSVVYHVVDCPTPKDQAGGVATARCRGKSRPDLNSSRRLGLPHGGRQLSSICDGRCHGDGKIEGKTRGTKCRWCRNRVEHKHGEGHHDVPRFGALVRDNTPTPACLFYMNEDWSYNNCSLVCSGEGESCRWPNSLLLP